MYHVIQKDRVIGAITWLKQHNPHCADMVPNELNGDALPSVVQIENLEN